MQSSKKAKQSYQKKLKDFTTAHNLYIQNRKTNSLDSSKNAKLAYTIGEPPKRLEQFASFFVGLII